MYKVTPKRGLQKNMAYIDGRGPSTSPTTRRLGPTTRAMAKKIQEDWDAATDGRETFLYMFQEAKTLVE